MCRSPIVSGSVYARGGQSSSIYIAIGSHRGLGRGSCACKGEQMKRRQFLQAAGLAAATTAIAKPAIAQAMPELKWRLTASWPKTLDILYGACETLAKTVADATDNKFQIQVFAGGEIVPP